MIVFLFLSDLYWKWKCSALSFIMHPFLIIQLPMLFILFWSEFGSAVVDGERWESLVFVLADREGNELGRKCASLGWNVWDICSPNPSEFVIFQRISKQFFKFRWKFQNHLLSFRENHINFKAHNIVFFCSIYSHSKAWFWWIVAILYKYFQGKRSLSKLSKIFGRMLVEVKWPNDAFKNICIRIFTLLQSS